MLGFQSVTVCAVNVTILAVQIRVLFDVEIPGGARNIGRRSRFSNGLDVVFGHLLPILT